MTKPKKTIRELASEHWEVLYTQRLMEKQLAIDFFIHGYKHGKEGKDNILGGK